MLVLSGGGGYPLVLFGEMWGSTSWSCPGGGGEEGDIQ